MVRFRLVNNVYFMEVPDIYSYIKADGFLLTTLYPISDNDDLIESFVPNLAKMNVAGIAIKPGRYIDEIPKLMLNQAEKYNLPLIKLTAEANLSTLAHNILASLLDSRTEMLAFRNTIHQQMLQLLLDNANLKKFVNSFATLIDKPVIILNNELECVESSINRQAIEIHQHTGKRRPSSINQIDLTIQVHENLYGLEKLFFQSIYAGGYEFGYLVVLLEEEQSYSENLIISIEQASFLVAILFQKEQALIRKEREYLNSFVSDIFNEQIKSQTEIAEKAKVFNWQFTFPITILSIKTNVKDSQQKASIYNRILDRRIIEQTLLETIHIPKENCRVLYHNDSIVCIINLLKEEKLEEKLRKTGRIILSKLQKYGNFGISISDTVHHVSRIKECYENSLLVFDIYQEELNNNSFVHFYKDIGLFRLFHHIKDLSVLEEFMMEKLGEVIEYDRKTDSNLLETVKYYIKNNMNLQKTSKDMFIHYNTMRYRLKKLKDLGINCDDGFELMETYLAYQVYFYLKLKKGITKNLY